MYKLTARQREILRLLVRGKRQKEIAKELFLSIQTVEAQIKKARMQWDCQTTVQLVAKIPEWRLREMETLNHARAR